MPKKIVLAYSGGLDTSVILKWLQNKYECPVVTFTADLGQGEELSPVRKKAESLGVKEIFVEDLKEEFVKNDYRLQRFDQMSKLKQMGTISERLEKAVYIMDLQQKYSCMPVCIHLARKTECPM